MRPEKKLLLDEIKDKIESSNAMIITKYQSVEPNASWEFRSSLQKLDSEFEIVKKRIFLKAANECGIEVSLDALPGNIGVVFLGENTIDATKAFYKFSTDNNDLFEVLLGRFEKKIYSPKEVKQLSKLPSMDEIRAQFIGLLQAPMSQTLSVMESLLTSVIYCLDNKAKESA